MLRLCDEMGDVKTLTAIASVSKTLKRCKKCNNSYHPRHALTWRHLLVHVELRGHIVLQACLIRELWAQPCSVQPLARGLAVRTAIGARVSHHIHLGREKETK